MPPRTPACRSAVQHATLRRTQPIWITDDVLADAFHRFLNVSNASRKRYGSNVPGPLEARRRASKRRIMGLATASPGIGPDIGALFGTDKPGLQAWTWEAPKRVERPLSRDNPPSTALPQWLSDFGQVSENHPRETPNPVEAYQSRLASICDPNELGSLWSEVGVEPQHKVLFSQMANTHFLDNLNTPGMGYRPFFGFLRNPHLNIPEAQNIKAFVHRAKEKGIPKGCLGELINRIRDSLRLGLMSGSELHAVVDSLPELCVKACQKDPKAVNNWQFGAYWAIWRGMTSCKIVPIDKFGKAIIQKMAEHLLVLKDPPAISDAAKLEKISATSHTDPALFRLEIYGQLWPTKSYAEPHDFTSHFVSWTQTLVEVNVQGDDCAPGKLESDVLKSLLNSMDANRAQKIMADTTSALLPASSDAASDEGARRLLHFWFATISETRHHWLDIFARDTSLALRIDPVLAGSYLKNLNADMICRLWIRYWLPQYVAEDGGAEKWGKRQKRVRRFFEERRQLSSGGEARRITLFFDAICALKAEGLPYATALSKSMEFILIMYGPSIAHQFQKKVVKERLTIKDPRPFAAAIDAIAERNPMQALKYFKSCPTVWLSLCPRLPLALVQHDSLPRDELFALLERREPVIQIPSQSSTTTTNGSSSSLSALDSKLVHFIAYAYANQSSRPTRHRFRNVYFCYLYLRDHGAPLAPLFTKALVRAAVTAPLENREWVSTMKLRWVLHLVRAVEGADVAAKLDELVWRWRGEVIAEARRRWDAAGLFARRGPSTVTMVRREGLFEHDFPRWRRSFRKVVVRAAFSAPRFLRRPRSAVGEKGDKAAWGRLSRRDGGKGGVSNPGGRYKWHHVSLY